MFGRMTATPLIRLDAGQSLEVAVAELLVATDYPQIARRIQFPTTAILLLALTQQAWVSTSRSKRHCSLMTWDDRASGACDDWLWRAAWSKPARLHDPGGTPRPRNRPALLLPPDGMRARSGNCAR